MFKTRVLVGIAVLWMTGVWTIGPIVAADPQPAADAKSQPPRAFDELARRLGVERPRPDPADVPLFNGKDLTGWWTPGKLKAWHVEGDQIVLHPGGGDYLRTDKEYRNFILRLDYKLVKGGNSGIAIRTPHTGWPSADGMELQLLDRSGMNKHSTMAVYGNVEPLARADKSNDWNHLIVMADGPMISAWINGKLVQHVDTSRMPELKHRPVKGWIGIQDHTGAISVKNIFIRELPASESMRHGALRNIANEPKTADALLLDRLINNTRLAADDGLHSHFVRHEIPAGDKPTVVADLTGPGAIVRWQDNRPGGRVALYFDGEQTPRIDCPADKLQEKLPVLSEDRSPLTTCVVFAKSLRIERSGVQEPGVFSADWVSLPASVKAVSYDGTPDSLARGYLPACEYRLYQNLHGALRMVDQRRYSVATPQKLAEGQTQTLTLSAPLDPDKRGAARFPAVVARWEVKVPKSTHLHDLWIKVFVDGEKEPSISAPLDLVFAGLETDGKSWPNYMVTDRGGWLAQYLPIPFAREAQLVLENRGKAPVADVQMQAVWKLQLGVPFFLAMPQGAWRLHGQYLPGHEGEDEKRSALLNLAGPGNLMGVVFRSHQKNGKALASKIKTTRDGAALDSMTDVSLAELLQGTDTRSHDRTALAGHKGNLSWRYFSLAPLDFQKELRIELPESSAAGDCLMWYYAPTK